MFKKLSVFTLFFVFMLTSLSYSTTITLRTIKRSKSFTADVSAKKPLESLDKRKLYLNVYSTPLLLDFDNKTYDAFCVDFFAHIHTGVWNNAKFSSAKDYFNTNYVDPENSLNYAIYNLYHNWDTTMNNSESKSFAQLNTWDILYDFQPIEDQCIDKNFIYWNVKNAFGKNYTKKAHNNSLYQNCLLNSRSNRSYEVESFIDQFSVVEFGDTPGKYQTLLIRKTNSPVPEPATLLLFGIGLIWISKKSKNSLL